MFDEVEDLRDVCDSFHDRVINLAMCYMLDNHAKSSIEGFGFDFYNQEGNEEEIKIKYDEREDEEILERNLEQHEQAIRQQNEDKHGEGYAEYRGAGNPNFARRCRFQWRGVECDLLDDDGVFIMKGQVIAYDLMEPVFND